MPTVLIRQIPDDYAEANGLSKYNRSRMPGCKDKFSAGMVDGRYVTGIDEEARNVKLEDKEKVKATRESFQKRTGQNLDAINEEFWDNFYVVIDADKPKMFNTDIALDNIGLKMLLANGIVAPDKDATANPLYREALYYAYTEESEDREEITTRKKRDNAIKELLSIEDSKDKMLLYGQYLEGLKYIDKLSHNTLYKMLRAYIEDKNIKNAENFIKAVALPVEELQQKILVDKAIKARIIQLVSLGRNKGKVYQYGQVTVGNSIEDVYRNFALPEFATELYAIKKELEK